MTKEPVVLGRPDFEHAKGVSKLLSQVRLLSFLQWLHSGLSFLGMQENISIFTWLSLIAWSLQSPTFQLELQCGKCQILRKENVHFNAKWQRTWPVTARLLWQWSVFVGISWDFWNINCLSFRRKFCHSLCVGTVPCDSSRWSKLGAFVWLLADVGKGIWIWPRVETACLPSPWNWACCVLLSVRY